MDNQIVNTTIVDGGKITHKLLFVDRNRVSGRFIHVDDIDMFNKTSITDKMVKNLPFNYISKFAEVANGDLHPLELKHIIIKASGIHLQPLRSDFVIF